MSEIKHTPWRVSLTDEITVVDSENNDVMTVSGEYETEYEEMAKRARLIAAAPALLEALQSIRRYGLDTLSGRADGGADDREWQRESVNEMTKRARIAIEKATGSQS